MDPLKTMSFTKWFAVSDYAYSLGFPMTQMPDNLLNTVRTPPLKDSNNLGLVGIKTPDNGRTITNAIGWDMSVKFGWKKWSMVRVITDAGYGAIIKKNSPTLPNSPGMTMGSMSNNYGEITEDQQSSIMFAFGEWYDGVQAQLTTPSIYSKIEKKDQGPNAGKLSKPLKLITPFENAFDNLGLSKKAIKQLTDAKSGFLAITRNTALKRQVAGAEEWAWNTPYIFIRNLIHGAGPAQNTSDRKNMLQYFYFRSKWEQEIKTSPNLYSGKRPFRYFGYPLTSILYATKYPATALATVDKEEEVKVPSVEYAFSNNGSASLWQQVNDPSAVLSFTDKARPALWVIRSLSSYGNASKAGGRMHPPKPKPQFPSTSENTSPDYSSLGFWAAGQSSPTQFNDILTAVVDDPSPTMSTLLGAAPSRTKQPGSSVKNVKPIASAELTATTGKTPTKPKRSFSPDGVKVTINDFTKKDVFPMGKSWLVLNITPDQKVYDKIMKDQEKTMIGAMKMKKKVKLPTNFIKQYPKVIQLAFQAGSILLINTNGKSKPEWKEYKWDRDKPPVTVSKDCRFSFIDNDILNGISFSIFTSIGDIDIKLYIDSVAQQMVTKVDAWFKKGSTELKVEVGAAKGSMMLPINIMTDIRGDSPDVAPHSIIDTNMAVDWYQRSLITYPPKELITDSYPDAWTSFGTEVEVGYFNADSLAKKLPLMFQAIPFDPSTAKEIDITKQYIELELFVVSNTDTYTGFNYSLNEFSSEKLVFPCDERYLALRSITNDPSTGEPTTELIEPAKVSRGKSISSIWISKDSDQAKIEFKSGETIIMPDEVNRGFSAIEHGNQQELTGLITQIKVNTYASREKGFTAAQQPNYMMIERTMKNIPLNIMKLMSYEDSSGDKIECGAGGFIFEDEDRNINVILPNPDPDLGLVKFKLLWKESV